MSGIAQSISGCRAVVLHMRTGTSSDDYANGLKDLADALMADHAISHKLDSIEKAVSIYEQVLRLRPLTHEWRAQAVNDLGDALYFFCAYHRTEYSQVHRCLELLREAVELRPSNHPLRDLSLHNLARALLFVGCEQQLGDSATITDCIVLNREALQLRPVGHPERHNSLSNLAVALRRSFAVCGDPALIAECIDMNREALQLRGLGHPLRVTSLNNLAVALGQSASFQGGLEALAESHTLLREVLELRPPGHPLRFQALDNLANSLATRCQVQSSSTALSEAITLRREALKLLPSSHPDRSKVMDNLARSLVSETRLRGDVSAIGEAIALLREALLLRPPGSPFRHQSLLNLAEALEAQFDVDKDPACIAEPISLHREALDLCPNEHTDRPVLLHRLGCLLSRPERQSWPEALVLLCEAVKSCPGGHPSLSLFMSGMSNCFLDPASPFFDLSRGITHLSEGYSNELSHVNQRLGQAVLDLRAVETAFRKSMKDADAVSSDRCSGRILELYAQVIGLLPHAANFGIDHKTRLEIITGSDELARNAAARAFLLGHISQAVELLEEGRGIFWTQALHLRSAGFDGIPDIDREKLLRLLRMLEHGTRSAESSDQSVVQREEALERRRRLNVEAEALISKIRAYPGCTRFLLPAAFDGLLNGLLGGFVVVLNASKLAHHALLLHKATGLATSIKLEAPSAGFDLAALRVRLPRDMRAQMEDTTEKHTRAMRLSSGQVGSLEDVLSQLWTSLVQPVIRKLGLQEAIGRARPRLWWCVTGELGFLPIHAARTYRGSNARCTADYVVSSYIPTLSSLTKARSGWVPIPHASIAGLVICETYADNALARCLPAAEEEVCLVRECFRAARARVLNAHSPHTSLAELRAALEDQPAHVLHLACHGVQDTDPLSSALVMQDGKLAIKDMLQLNLPQPVLAYLSACQTAKGDRNAPDQAVHLAASMLFCGFRSVVGTMWLMHDEDGPRLARQFYEALFAREELDLDDIAYALDEAIQFIRQQGVPAERWALFMHMGG